MIEVVKEILQLPSKAYVPRVLPKNFFDRNFKITAAEKKLLNTPFLPVKSTWLAELNSKTVNINAFEDENYHYTRIPIFLIQLSQEHWYTSLNKMITLYHKHIPFPVVLFIYSDSCYVVSTAIKTINGNDSSKRVIEKEYTTPQISRLFKDSIELRFRESVNFTSLNRIDLKSTYESYVAAIVNYKRASIKGDFESNKEVKILDQNLDELAIIEKQILTLRNKLHKAKDLRLKVALQMELGELKTQKTTLENSI